MPYKQHYGLITLAARAFLLGRSPRVDVCYQPESKEEQGQRSCCISLEQLQFGIGARSGGGDLREAQRDKGGSLQV